MPMFSSPRRAAPRFRVMAAVLALAAVVIAGCDDDDPTWPSSGPVEAVAVHTLPASAPRVLVLNPTSGTGPESLRLIGVPMDSNEDWVDMPVTWSTSAASVATVSGEGVVTAVGVGSATITGSAGGQSGTIVVTVREFPQVETVTLTPPNPFLSVGQTVQMSARSADIGGVEIPGEEYEWESSNTGVATVTDAGLVTVVGQGEATITATTVQDGVSGSTTVTVATPLVPGVVVAVPDIGPDNVRDWSFRVPADGSVEEFTVEISGGTSGDADVYVYAPGVNANFTNFTCRPWLIGSDETCVITAPAAGTWRIRVHAYPSDGTVSGLNLVLTTAP